MLPKEFREYQITFLLNNHIQYKEKHLGHLEERIFKKLVCGNL